MYSDMKKRVPLPRVICNKGAEKVLGYGLENHKALTHLNLPATTVLKITLNHFLNQIFEFLERLIISTIEDGVQKQTEKEIV